MKNAAVFGRWCCCPPSQLLRRLLLLVGGSFIPGAAPEPVLSSVLQRRRSLQLPLAAAPVDHPANPGIPAAPTMVSPETLSAATTVAPVGMPGGATAAGFLKGTGPMDPWMGKPSAGFFPLEPLKGDPENYFPQDPPQVAAKKYTRFNKKLGGSATTPPPKATEAPTTTTTPAPQAKPAEDFGLSKWAGKFADRSVDATAAGTDAVVGELAKFGGAWSIVGHAPPAGGSTPCAAAKDPKIKEWATDLAKRAVEASSAAEHSMVGEVSKQMAHGIIAPELEGLYPYQPPPGAAPAPAPASDRPGAPAAAAAPGAVTPR